MQLISSIVIILLVLLGPALVLFGVKRVKFLGLLGSVFLSYAVGLIFSFLIPDTSLAMDLSEILVPIAIPLILFSADFSSLKKLAKPTLVSFALVIFSVTLVSSAAFFLFRSRFEDAAALSGMMIGLYTGGTPNLMAIGVALGVSDTVIGLANTTDLVVGGIYFILLISVMPKLVRRFLTPFSGTGKSDDPQLAQHIEKETIPEKHGFSWARVWPRAFAVFLGVLCLGVSAGAALLITGKLNVMIVMLGVTTLGIACSFIRRVRELPGSFSVGQYLIYMFSLAIGLSFDFSMITVSMAMMLALFATVTFGSVLVHILLARLFRLDSDTTLIISTAGLYGPAFIVPVANAMKNREVVLPGLICGILGYAIGNYLGIGVTLLLQLF